MGLPHCLAELLAGWLPVTLRAIATPKPYPTWHPLVVCKSRTTRTNMVLQSTESNASVMSCVPYLTKRLNALWSLIG